MNNFTIRGENFHWIDKAEDNVTDLCLHGHVTVAIGNTVLTGDGNVSAAALLLLKSLTEDHTPGEIQMVPCCGHFWCPDEALENVTIIGCDTGLDWTITHENGAVRLTAMDGETVLVDKYAYLEEVLRFAENVDRYFSHCPPRVLPEDSFTRNGYVAFQNEWLWRYRAGARAWMHREDRIYTITETHTHLRHDDMSDVELHDYVITVVWLEGDDLHFFLPDGITVMRWAECNPTGRYLQTGAAEIRLIGVKNPEEVDSMQFEIFGQSYRPDKGEFSLCMRAAIPEGEFRPYKFLCERVEYRFDTYAGDSVLQQARDRMINVFRESVRKGHGAAHARLEHLEDADTRDYADILIDAMASEQRYDRQGNRDRTVYLLDLYDLFPAPERERILRTVLDRHMQISYDNMTTYAPLLKGFAGRGVTEAGEILKKLYNHYRTALENRTEPPDGYDELGSMVEHLAWELDIRPHSWEQAPVQRTPEPPLTIETVIERALNWTPPGTFHPARYRAFLRAQPTGKIEQLAQAAEAAEDPEVKARLWSLFDGVAYPGDPAEMITLLKERLDALKSWVDTEDPVEKQRRLSTMCLARALALMQHPAVRALALEMAEISAHRENLRIYALDLWCANFDEKTDVDRLMDFLEKRPSGEEYTNLCHDEDMAILRRLFRRKYEDPRMYGIPVRIYMETYCSTCRHTAVKILAEHGMLQEGLRRQCLWDCELSTRELAKEMEGKTYKGKR